MDKLLAGAAFALLLLAAGMLYFHNNLDAPASPVPKPITVEIKSGMNTARIAAMLEEKGAIRSKTAFMILAKLGGKGSALKAGEYEIDAADNASAILDRLVEGKPVLHHITVPEGYTLTQIAQLVAEKGFGDEQSFLQAASDSALLAEFGINVKNAEGYLLPETYHLRKDTPPREIVRKMLEVFSLKTTPLVEKYQSRSPLTFHQIITLASIIEKEAAGPQEYPLISAVFHNRLKKNMPLQADPTVIYAIPGFDGNIRKKDLNIKSPYNTYRYRGLPPGPIANPGLGAIEAAFAPANEGFLYFVAMRSEKRHYFSSTLQEHNRAVKKYQLGLSGALSGRAAIAG